LRGHPLFGARAAIRYSEEPFFSQTKTYLMLTKSFLVAHQIFPCDRAWKPARLFKTPRGAVVQVRSLPDVYAEKFQCDADQEKSAEEDSITMIPSRSPSFLV
jgi:hypothetical protein